ncbi:xylose isomerase-like TIM barrel [Beauveria bassiana ARSEF 2860]|uniref:Xylose isomerase-like TIM barrel n=1 Tax=Beauveria bassiana (strain ARSEF 2860) TaxID=655819 RepID=J4KQQ7_BEAB2|nr:xylose isomerase-like TIM barrel [Beauveria bassiana ARSEF 2860]EJP69624.1 xylose isomerase-like TIM barrel [Beauveria bassiana ARSEF 2860]
MACKPSICTISLGRAFAGHSLEHKLDMAQKYGFKGIELFYEDLQHLATVMPGGCSPPNLLAAARQVRRWCETRKQEIICLQPFLHFGGLLDRSKAKQDLETVAFWTDLAATLGTDLILLPSSFLPATQLTDNLSVLVHDLQNAAEIGLKKSPAVRFAFEALCWGTRVNAWEDSWKIVTAVNRPNFGLCIDTFNIAGHIFADPAASSGCRPNADLSLKSSMQRLMAQVDVSKVFLVQVADAERLAKPLDEAHPFYDAEQPSRMSWSRNCRLFYGEDHLGGHLPVDKILQTVVHGLGYRGWLSFEVFHQRLADSDGAIPEHFAARASWSWARLVRDLSLESARPRPDFGQEKERVVLKDSNTRL